MDNRSFTAPGSLARELVLLVYNPIDPPQVCPGARRRETAARDLRARELVLLVYNTIYQLEGDFKIKSRLG